MFCKYQLIKYKPWTSVIQNVWDSSDISDEMLCQKWNDFLLTRTGQTLVPNWRPQLFDAESFISSDSVNSDEDSDNESQHLQMVREEWMYLADLCTNEQSSQGTAGDSDYWALSRDKYTLEQIGNMPTWLQEVKKNNLDCQEEENFELNTHLFNRAQRIAFDIVVGHFQSNEKPLLITGTAGSGKSFLINSIRSVLKENCIVAAFFGIAAFNVKGQTLHSLLQLPIRGKNNHDLKGPALMKLQQRLHNIKYIIIDEFSVVGQKILGWIDKRCRQGTGEIELPFGGIAVILVGDIAQLPPVMDKVLYHRKPNDEISTAGFAVYSSFDTVVKVTVNQRSKGDEINQKMFRTVLLNLRNGNSTLDDWNLLLTRTFSNLKNVSNISEYVKLSFSNENVAKNNYEALESLNVPIAHINARHNIAAASKLSPDDMGGLHPKLFMCLGARVMLTRNLWTTRGLCNGSMGVIKDLVFQEGDHPPLLPIAVIVQFAESYTDPSICVNEPRCVPIVPETNVSNLLGSFS